MCDLALSNGGAPPGRGSSSSEVPDDYGRNIASACASATITSPVCSPSGLLGTVTKMWIARTVRPAAPVPSAQLAASEALLSQNCSLRITNPTPGMSTLWFGEGFSGTVVPFTVTPTSCVSPTFEDAPAAPAALLATERTS